MDSSEARSSRAAHDMRIATTYVLYAIQEKKTQRRPEITPNLLLKQKVKANGADIDG
jgi:hypothetical protein